MLLDSSKFWQYYCMDAPHGRKQNYPRMLRAILKKIREATPHEVTTVQTTYLPSRKRK